MNLTFKEKMHTYNKWLDGQIELFTLSELHSKRYSFTKKDLNVYSLKWMKKYLAQHHQKSNCFTAKSHRLNIVCFVNMANTILLEQ